MVPAIWLAYTLGKGPVRRSRKPRSYLCEFGTTAGCWLLGCRFDPARRSQLPRGSKLLGPILSTNRPFAADRAPLAFVGSIRPVTKVTASVTTDKSSIRGDESQARVEVLEQSWREPSAHVRGGSFDIHGLQDTLRGHARNTVAVWSVKDLHAEASRLRDRGGVFEEYDIPEIRTVDGIAAMDDEAMNAWFRDPDGNVISMVQQPDEHRESMVTAMIAASDLDRTRAWYAEKLGFIPRKVFEGTARLRIPGPVRSVSTRRPRPARR